MWTLLQLTMLFVFKMHQVASAQNDESCGTTSFTGPTGIITSPQFPLPYPHRINCVYSIDVDRTKAVSLNFLSFTLEGESYPSWKDDCSYDWITVRCLSDGSVSANPYHNKKYCGVKTEPFTLTFSNCDSLTLNFVTDSSEAHRGFQFRYNVTSEGYTSPNTTDEPNEGCGNSSFTGPVGLIASPRFPLAYPNNLNCVYSVDVDPTKMVVLHFLSFNIEGTSHFSYLDSCNYDWLMISCLLNGSASGFSQRNRKYCGENTTPLILGYSNCESLTLNFVTDSSVTSGGFQLQYTIRSEDQSDCGGTFFSGSNGIITSPNYPFPYPHNMSCSYSIDGGRNSSVLVKFENFNLKVPNSADYCKDWLMISCKESSKANPNNNKKFCGSIQWVSSMRFVDCPSLVLEFFSDSSINSAGFMIQYTVVENSNFTDDNSELDCGATLFTNSSGFISLPRNPTNYLASVNCTYTISTNQKSYIWLETYLSSSMPLLNSFRDCATDSLTIGCASEKETDLNANTTRVFCRQGRPPFSYSSGKFVFADCRTLKLSIRSTNYDNRETFRIPFSVFGKSEICGNTSFSASSGVIFSRRLTWHYPESVNCLYTIDNGHVNSVVLLLNLNFGNRDILDASCNSSWLTITCLVNGTSVPHPLADRKLCLNMYSFTTRFPACRSVVLNYSMDYISINTGFFTLYRMKDYDPECGNTSFSGPNGRINSPKFPLSYPHNLSCLYYITGGQRNTILLSFLSFSLQGRSNTYSMDSCSGDWLTVSCLLDQSGVASMPSSKRYCGYKKTPLKFSFPNCEVVELNFQSDSSVTGKGFVVRYAAIQTDSLCGDPAYGPPSGVISFSRNYTGYGYSFDCNYVIHSTGPSLISLKIWSISLQSSVGKNCQSDWLSVTCINGQTALDQKVSHRSCDNLNSSAQFTFPSCAAAKVVYHRDSESPGKTFRIEYSVTNYVKTKVTIRGPNEVSVDFLEEKQFVFQCDATSDPSTPTTVRWFKTEPFNELVRDEPPYVNVSTETLVINIYPKCSRNCSKYLGEYRCVGDNGYSRDNRTITLTYQPPPGNHLTGSVIPEQEPWGVWKIILGAGVIGLVLLLIGVFLRLRLKQNSGEVNRRHRRLPNLSSIYEDVGYDSIGFPLEDLGGNSEGSTTRVHSMYEQIGYDSIDQVLEEIALREETSDGCGYDKYESTDAPEREATGRGRPMLDEGITRDEIGYLIPLDEITNDGQIDQHQVHDYESVKNESDKFSKSNEQSEASNSYSDLSREDVNPDLDLGKSDSNLQEVNSYLDLVSEEASPYLGPVPSEVNQYLNLVSEEVNPYLDPVPSEVNQYMDLVSEEVNPYLDPVPSEVNQYLDLVSAEVNPYLDPVPSEVNQYLDLVSEEVNPYLHAASSEVNQYLDMGHTKMNQYMDQGHEEVNQ